MLGEVDVPLLSQNLVSQASSFAVPQPPSSLKVKVMVPSAAFETRSPLLAKRTKSPLNASSASLNNEHCFVIDPVFFANLSEVIVVSRSVFQKRIANVPW
jgi:hypothetical protein